MKGTVINAVILGVLLVVCEAHRHNLDHHGRHHEDGKRREHRRHPGDLKVTLSDLSTPENETITIDVTRKFTGPENSQNTIRVNLRVHAVKGIVHINGHKVDHSVVTSVHVRTIINEFSPSGVIERKPAVVQVRVLVAESTKANGMRMLSIQEEIVEVSNDEVDQIEVKEIVLEFNNNVMEQHRSITVIKIAESKIRTHNRNGDKHMWACKGRRPHDPFSVSKDEMKRWRHRHRRPPGFELGHNKEDFDFQGDDDNKKGHHHHGHHRHHNHWSRKFCRWFHKLPVATRAAFGLSVVLFGILMVAACWTCCCRKPAKKPQVKCELDDTASVDLEMEAEPLPDKKKPLDEQPLVA